MKNHFFRVFFSVLVLLVHLPGRGEDIDLFVGAAPNAADVPNVLIILDNTANWNTAFVNEKAALVSLFNGLPVDKFRVGLMMFTETGGGGVAGNSGNDGAYVRAAIRLMNSTNKPLYANLINSLDQTGDKSNGGKIGKSMEEAYLYLAARTPHAGNDKGKTDYTGSTNGTAQDKAIYALPGNALASKSATTYISPVLPGCAKNYIIYISNGAAQDNASDTTQATGVLAAAGGSTTAISLTPSGSQDNVADEWAKFLKWGCTSTGTVADALVKIEAYNNGNGTTPAALTVCDYWAASVTGVNFSNVSALNALVLAQAPGGANTTAKVQALVTAVAAASADVFNSLQITTYTVDVNKVTTGQGPGWTALLKSMAAVSSGKYFDVSSSGTQIVDALNTIFSEIQSVNSVFASVSLPVSVNTQGTFLNQVYVGMFRPDQDAKPRWAGNLKQYKLGDVNGSLKLVDADGASAINSQTGFIAECARSYWTPSSVDSEWTFKPQGDCLTVANSQASNYPDGNVVEKGAQAYKLRGSSTRTVKTCSPTMASCTTLTTFNNSNVTQAMLGAASTTERDALINWAIGQDIDDEDIDVVTTAERRLSAHGDVVHSRPVAIDFGSTGSPQVVVFYGANDGMLRAVNANRSAAIGTIPAGGEMWSFMAPEFYSQIKRLRDNTTLVSYPTTTATGALPKTYGVDGPITSFKGTVGGASKAFVYASMRRGGRSIYAFDVTNSLTAPSNPTLKWKIGCPSAANDTDCTGGMSGIGQTWSSPKSLTATGYGAGASPMLIFGGGYDTCDDYDALSSGGANHNCTSSSKGHFVYVVDADTGAVVKAFDSGETRGFVADATIVRDGAGQAIFAYTADLGGNVYRINFAGASTGWTMTKIASLGCSTTASCTANRKFVFAPSVIAVDGNYVVMLGSGDREKPLTYFASSNAVANYFFMFTDKPAVATTTWPGTTDCGAAIICLNSLLNIPSASATPSAADLALKKGWYLGLNSTEQVVTSALTIFGVVTFSTHQPAVPVAGSCSANLGTSRVYNIGFANAKSPTGDVRYADLAGDGLPPSPVGGMVTLDNGTTVPFCIGCSPTSPLEGGKKDSASSGIQHKNRLYWYINK